MPAKRSAGGLNINHPCRQTFPEVLSDSLCTIVNVGSVSGDF
jgi:hypothetical protein